MAAAAFNLPRPTLETWTSVSTIKLSVLSVRNGPAQGESLGSPFLEFSALEGPFSFFFPPQQRKTLLSVEILPRLGFPACPPWAGRGRKTFTCCSLPGRGHHKGNKTQAPGGGFFGWISVCLPGWGCSWLAWSPSLPPALTESRTCLLLLISACHIDCGRV